MRVQKQKILAFHELLSVLLSFIRRCFDSSRVLLVDNLYRILKKDLLPSDFGVDGCTLGRDLLSVSMHVSIYVTLKVNFSSNKVDFLY